MARRGGCTSTRGRITAAASRRGENRRVEAASGDELGTAVGQSVGQPHHAEAAVGHSLG